MYKFKSYLLSMLAVASMATLTSCGSDEEDPMPTIVLTGANANGGTIAAGTQYDITITATDNGGSKLDKYEVLYSQNGGQQNILAAETVTGINNSNFTETFEGTAASAGTEQFTFRITNKDGKTATKTVTFTILGNNPVEYTAKMMGASQSALGSFFSTQTGDVYLSSAAASNSQRVDMVYYYQTGGTIAAQQATLASPSHADAQTVYTGINSWSTKNTTQFKMGTSADYTGATNANMETAFNNASGGDTKASNLQVGNVLLFKTAAGKFGVLKVDAINTGTNPSAGTITISVKVQP